MLRLPNGKPVTKFSLAVDQGKLQLRAYEDKQGAKQQAVDIVANVVQILDKKPNGDRPPTAANRDEDPTSRKPIASASIMEYTKDTEARKG